MSVSPADLAKALSNAERWAVNDPDPQTKNEALGLINLVTLGEESAEEAIVKQFNSRLSFGTAGLRGELGTGPARMNRMVVMQTSAAFAQWLLQRAAAGLSATPPTIVVGFDARIKSDVFARAAAEVFAGAGLRTIMLPGPLPTPVTAFAVRHLNAAAGVMITASHNPPKDNGYKVFLGDADSGSQIVSPSDAEISAIIEKVAQASLSDIPLNQAFEFAGDEIFTAYTAAMQESWITPPEAADLKIVYTAMHGVGAATTRQLFTTLNLPELHAVEKQETPNGTFPTVTFPNPEEPGALDLAYEKAREIQADLIIAHDPDADRLAIALPDAESAAGFRMLTGNQLGLLLGWQAARDHHESGKTDGALACTIVSSPALKTVAGHYGLDYQETLSGFKWVSRVPGLIFGFEEALGYLTRPNLVRDKDGISAAADAVRLALKLRAEGKTLNDMLLEAAATFGSFASLQITVRLENVTEVALLAAKIRDAMPSAFGDFKVQAATDLLNEGQLPVKADVLKFELEDGSRVMIRPSGTEPKLKLYLDTFSDTGAPEQRIAAAEEKLQQLEAAVKATLNI